MTEITSLGSTEATAALQVVIELIRAGALSVGEDGSEAKRIIDTHSQLIAHFKAVKTGLPATIPVRF